MTAITRQLAAFVAGLDYQALPDEEALIAAFEAVAKREIAAFVDRVRESATTRDAPAARPHLGESRPRPGT